MKIIKIIIVLLSLLVLYACNEGNLSDNEKLTSQFKSDLQPIEEFGPVEDLQPSFGWWQKFKKWVEDRVKWGTPANNCPPGFGVCISFEVGETPGSIILTFNDSLQNKGIIEYTIEENFACLILKENVPYTNDSILTINDDFELSEILCEEFEFSEIIFPKGQYRVKYDTTKFAYPFVFIHAITTPLPPID
jgi:hypothetical protein